MARRHTSGEFLYNAVRASRLELENLLRKDNGSSALLVMVYLVGLVFLLFNLHPKFIFLTPVNLLFSLVVVLFSHPKWGWRLPLLLTVSFVVGMGIEIIGVQTGLIFGSYQYGEVLGPKWHGTPWMIGVNWAMLTYCCGVTVIRFSPRWGWFWRSFFGATLMLSLDFLMEPVAIFYDFWSWGGDGSIPLQNYAAWFLISFVLLGLFNVLFKDFRNKAAVTLFSLQFLFFFLLGIAW
jgi:putative membrane protein